MKASTFYCILILGLLSDSIFAQAQIQFDSTGYNLGVFEEGSELKRDIGFINSGNSPLLITRAMTTDAGLISYFPKDSIAPGDTGHITFCYFSGKIGPFCKPVVIISNAQKPVQQPITITGEVVFSPKLH